MGKSKRKVHKGFYIDRNLFELFKKWVEENYGNISISEALRNLIMEKIEESKFGEQMMDTAINEVCKMFSVAGFHSCIPFYRIEEIISEYKVPRSRFLKKLQEFAVIKYVNDMFVVCFKEGAEKVCQNV